MLAVVVWAECWRRTPRIWSFWLLVSAVFIVVRRVLTGLAEWTEDPELARNVMDSIPFLVSGSMLMAGIAAVGAQQDKSPPQCLVEFNEKEITK